MKTRDRGLTPKQARFVEEYLIDLNATAAAKRAGYSNKQKVAEAEGSRQLGKAKVRAAINARMNKIQQRLRLTQLRVLRELSIVGFSDLREFVNWNGDDATLHDCKDLGLVRRAAKSVRTTPGKFGTSVSIELHDKLGALKTLAQYTGITKGENNGDDSANGKSDSGRAEDRAKARSLAVQRFLDRGPTGKGE